MAFKCGMSMSFKQVINPHIKNNEVSEINANRVEFSPPIPFDEFVLDTLFLSKLKDVPAMWIVLLLENNKYKEFTRFTVKLFFISLKVSTTY